MEITSRSEEETVQAAQRLVSDLKAGSLVYLQGDLGAGKSVFARGLIRALMQAPDLEVPSPTFTLVQRYDAPLCPVFHFDLYRIEEAAEILELGWDDACYEGIVIVEWPERLGAYQVQPMVDVRISNDGGEESIRQIVIERYET